MERIIDCIKLDQIISILDNDFNPGNIYFDYYVFLLSMEF
jgi:hypothetical protein